jgi:hypothetical protein
MNQYSPKDLLKRLEGKGWVYVISGIGRPLYLPQRSHERGLRHRRLSSPRAWVEPALLVGDMYKDERPHFQSDDGRYLVRFPYYRRDDAAAQRIADALDGCLRLAHGPTLPEHTKAIGAPRAIRYTPGLIQTDERWLRPDTPWAFRRYDLRLYDHLRDDDKQIGELDIGDYLTNSIQAPELKWALRVLPVATLAPFLEALHFYSESIEHFHFAGDDIQTTLADPCRAPNDQVAAVKAEAAVWNAFKAVEAIIGDPPSDERRFRGKLTQAGIDPDEEVGYLRWGHQGDPSGQREPVSARIRAMSRCRDRRAAHGSRTSPDRGITFYEIMDFQATSRFCVMTAMLAKQESGRAAT